MKDNSNPFEQQHETHTLDRPDTSDEHTCDNTLKALETFRWDGEQSLDAWAERVLESLVRQFRGLQGTFYYIKPAKESSQTVNELTLLATYATNAGQAASAIRFGEGLVGQAAKSKELFQIDSMHPNSGAKTAMGMVPAQASVICPLVYQGTLYGILELSSHQALEEQLVARLRSQLPLLASTLMAVLNQETMRKLYQEAEIERQQARMKEQEARESLEEMRSTQSELQATQEEVEKLLKLSQFNEQQLQETEDGYRSYIKNLQAELDALRKERDQLQAALHTQQCPS